MTEPSNPAEEMSSAGYAARPNPALASRSDSAIELVCGNCGHSFLAPMASLANADARLKCPSCRKPFKMNQRFAHDAQEDLDKRRRAAPIDQVLTDLGKILGS